MPLSWLLFLRREGRRTFKDFCPISLMGSIYKLLAKVLVNSLKKVVVKVVSFFQNAFVEVDRSSMQL